MAKRLKNSKHRTVTRRINPYLGVCIGVGFIAILLVMLTWMHIDVFAVDAISEDGEKLNTTQHESNSKLVSNDLTLAVNVCEKAVTIATQQLEAEQIAQQAKLEEEQFLANKYWYVLQKAPAGGGVTLDLIRHCDIMCKTYNINPHLVWCIIDGESGYNANAQNRSSSARGLGQFLRSTAEVVYEDMLCCGQYDHIYAYDPYVNVNMMVAYLSYLRDLTGSARGMMNGYSGQKNGSYYRVVSNKMANLGYSITNTYYV